MSRRDRPAAALAAFGLLMLQTAAAADSGIAVGQPLAEALQALSTRQGLATVYSAELLPARLRVTEVPDAVSGEALRAALLAQHGLRCRMLHARCVVERAEPAPPAAAKPKLDSATRAPSAAPARMRAVEVSPSHYALGPEHSSYLSEDDIAATPHLADDVFRLARSIPGVAGGDIGAAFHVRGGQVDEVELRLDGLELYRPFHLQTLSNALGIVDSNLIGGIDVYTGAWPGRFGGRMSAVVDIRSREAGDAAERRIGVSAVNAFYSHAQASDDGNHDVLASARRGYLDVVLRFADPGGDIDPRYYDVFARYRYRLDDRQTLSWHVLHAGDDIAFDGNRGRLQSDGRSDASYLWLNWQADWSQAWSSESLLAFTQLDQSREGFSFQPTDSNAIVRDRRELAGLRFSHRSSWQWSARTLLEAGAEWRDEATDYDYRSTVEVFPLFDRPPQRYARATRRQVDGEQGAAWLDLQTVPAERWQLRGGLRYSRYAPDERADGQLDPHLALAWQPRPGSAWRLGWGGVSQAQRSDELAVEDGESLFYAPERARMTVLGWEQQLMPELGLRIEAFDKRWSDLRPRYENLFDSIELFPEAEGDRVRVVAERARSRGIELGLLGELHDGRWWARYVYSRTRERVDGAWRPRSWDQPHALQIGWDQRLPNDCRLTSQLDVHSGWPTTSVDVVEHADGRIETVLGPRNGDRYARYINLSTRISREWLLASGSVVWYFEVFNLLNRDNANMAEDFRLQRDDDGELRVHRDTVGGLPLLPSFGVVWKF